MIPVKLEVIAVKACPQFFLYCYLKSYYLR